MPKTLLYDKSKMQYHKTKWHTSSCMCRFVNVEITFERLQTQMIIAAAFREGSESREGNGGNTY